MSGHDLAIEVIDFRKVFSETVAADGITFALPRGVIGALVGPNGAGKTTTMRAHRWL
jgi:ABC-2 type transport system ATP-binding protein